MISDSKNLSRTLTNNYNSLQNNQFKNGIINNNKTWSMDQEWF